jgi:ABC-type spermidine/putrescine transport system permease subunit I
MGPTRGVSVLLIFPALAMALALFIYPLGYSLIGAFQDKTGVWTLGNFVRAWELYRLDTLFTVFIVGLSTFLIAVISVSIGGYLTLGNSPVAKKILDWLYRWPLFVPFIVAALCMRTFLGRNGMMNNAFVFLGLMDQEMAQSFLDWRGIVITFVWKQTPFVTLMVAGAMAGLDRSTIDAARNLGASRLRVLLEIVVPQIRRTLAVGLILSFVTMMSVLSVPIMLSGQSPSMLTVNMAWRINSVGDYGTANALGFVSYLLTGLAAWFYLREAVRDKQQGLTR